jgi:hypothetical protein
MKYYTLPNLSGVLTDDYLYFEGTYRPQSFFTLRDGLYEGKGQSLQALKELEQYWNDVYNLFLRKLTLFAGSVRASDEETLKLQALLQELIKVKGVIENASKADIMGG